MIKKSDEKSDEKALESEIEEVAYRNGYKKDTYLTKINNSAIREIFKK